jgi:hypothetical protein
MNIRIRSLFLAATAALALVTPHANAAPFAYTNGDVIVTFYKNGNTSDLEVNLGSITAFLAASPGSTTTFTTVSASALQTFVEPTLDGIAFSAIACTRAGDNSTTISTANTVWATSPRAANNVQTTPWVRFSSSVLGNSAAVVATVGNSAVSYSGNSLGGIVGPNNETNLVVIPQGNLQSYVFNAGSVGTLKGTFQGDIEQLTPTGFAAGGVAVRSDLYQIVPGSGNATYLGYFQLAPSGVFTFTAAGGSTPPNPVTLAISRSGGMSSIQFVSQSGYQYTLRYTNSTGLSASIGSWPAAAPVSGTGSTVTITDTTADPIRYYVVGAQ